MQKQVKIPISHDGIYKIMLWVTFGVSGIFLLKNLIGKNVSGSLAIGICIVVLAGSLYAMQLKRAKDSVRQLFLAISILCLVFVISLYSGASYSDDFPMFLAVIGMTGLYLQPKFTLIQIFTASVLLVFMYILHPEKAENLSQYILCEAVFILAASLFYQTIKRGRAFIEISEERAKEAEKLLGSIRTMGKEIEDDFEQSSRHIEDSTQELQQGSLSITQSANEMTDSCNEVQDRIRVSEQSITELNTEVNKFEQVLADNQINMKEMREQLVSVSATVSVANEVFQAMEKKMNEVASIADQLNAISFNTSILSLNASIEAARAGKAGVGFDVVATEMRDLFNHSNVFSEQVSEVIRQVLAQVGDTAGQFMDSTKALKESEETMDKLQESFTRLMQQFSALYGNIETQNSSVSQVNVIFNDLKQRIMEMRKYSAENEKAVDAIVEAMEQYKANISDVIRNTSKEE